MIDQIIAQFRELFKKLTIAATKMFLQVRNSANPTNPRTPNDSQQQINESILWLKELKLLINERRLFIRRVIEYIEEQTWLFAMQDPFLSPSEIGQQWAFANATEQLHKYLVPLLPYYFRVVHNNDDRYEAILDTLAVLRDDQVLLLRFTHDIDICLNQILLGKVNALSEPNLKRFTTIKISLLNNH